METVTCEVCLGERDLIDGGPDSCEWCDSDGANPDLECSCWVDSDEFDVIYGNSLK